MRETRVYDSGDGWLHKVELWHGASETFVVSDTRKRNEFPRTLRRWKPYKVEEQKKEKSWLLEVLKRAKENGDVE